MRSLPRNDIEVEPDALRHRYEHAEAQAVEDFWQSVTERGTPLHDPATDRFTFLWRGPAAAEHPDGAASVHVHINRVTDKDHHDRGLMHHVPGTDIWVLTLRLPSGIRAGYGFNPLRPGEAPHSGPPRLGHYDTRRDQRNPLPPLIDHGARGLSVVRGEDAPAQPEWENDHVLRPPRGQVVRESRALPRDRRAESEGRRGHWLYLPPDPGVELPLLTLFDAETWFGDLPLPQALEAAAAAGRIPPVAVLGIANRDRLDRLDCLGANAGFLREVAADATAWAADTATATGARLAGRDRRIIAGQSLGGLSALTAALELPRAYGAALAHSSSLWWTPDRRSTPRDLGTVPDGGWITERFAAAEPNDVRIRLDVGEREDRTVPHTRALHRTLLGRGWDAEMAVYNGGHDFSCWRGALLDGLAAVLGDRR